MKLPQMATRLAPLFLALAAITAAPASATTLYQSATFTGDDTGEAIVQDGRSIGAVFSLAHTTQITDVGAQFGGFPGGTIFAAIVPLSSLGADPAGDASDLSAIAVASTVFAVTNSAPLDVTAPLSVMLKAGDYALIFGSGQFGADGFAGLGEDNSDIGSPVLIQTLFDNTWQPETDGGIRIFVDGATVPEPGAWAMMVLGFGLLGAAARRRRVTAAA